MRPSLLAMFQAAPPLFDWWLRLLEMLGAGTLGAVVIYVGNRTRFRILERDVKGLGDEMRGSIARIERMISDDHNDSIAKEMREASETRQALDAIRSDNKLMREQIFALVRLMVQMARATPGMNPSDVDDAMSRVLSLEVKRAD